MFSKDRTSLDTVLAARSDFYYKSEIDAYPSGKKKGNCNVFLWAYFLLHNKKVKACVRACFVVVVAASQ